MVSALGALRPQRPTTQMAGGGERGEMGGWGRALVGASNAFSFLFFWLLATVNFSSYFC